MTAPRGLPTAAELTAATREYLVGDVLAATDGRTRFLSRVAANVLGQIERELSLGPAYERAHASRLAALGLADDAALAAAIRDGSLDDRRAEVFAVTRARVVDRLRVTNPRHLLPEDRIP
jgi:Domain of unknown function (DUF6285)